MGVTGVLCACVLAASSRGGTEPSEPGGAALPPKRDLFGTSEPKAVEGPASPARVWGTVELSDGTRAEGWLSLAPGKPLEVYDLEAKEWREFTIDGIAGLRATPRKEELEREWRWKEYGKDEKVYTGRAYPKRWLDHELVLLAEDEEDGKPLERIRCHVKGAAIYVTTEPDDIGTDEAEDVDGETEREKPGRKESGQERPADDGSPGGERKPAPPVEPPRRLRFIIRQYEKGKLGQAMDDLVYVKQVLQHEKGRGPAGSRTPRRLPDAKADAKDAAPPAK